jgi:hypothetical protein
MEANKHHRRRICRWEVNGGFRKGGPDLKNFRSNLSYHRAVMKDVDSALSVLDLPEEGYP